MKDLPINQVLCGDCLEVMKAFPEQSIDCVVTDPPYGISFMGKKWDLALPPKEAFQQVLRVLKLGALAFVMSSPRQDVLWRMMAMLENCGFQLRQSFISWIYKSGFPKAYDLSLGIDHKFIRQEFVCEHGRKPTREELKKLLKEKRKTIGKYKPPEMKKEWNLKQAKNEDVDCCGGTFTASKRRTLDLTKPTSDLTKKWQGWKSITGLKPALECILMVNKPLSEKTIVDNVLKHGVGAINVDACRIPFQNEPYDINKKCRPNTRGVPAPELYGGYEAHLVNKNQMGRFPANLIISDKALDTGKITKSGTLKPHHKITSSKTSLIYGKYENQPPAEHPTYGDVGDQSRYFDLDAWARHRGFLDVPKPSKKEKNEGLDDFEEKQTYGQYEDSSKAGWTKKNNPNTSLNRNFHPTVKPVKLMAYLIELGCPPNGIVLDPFVGTGSTLISAHRLNRKWIGIDVNEEYVKIAKHRLTILSYKLPKYLGSVNS